MESVENRKRVFCDAHCHLQRTTPDSKLTAFNFFTKCASENISFHLFVNGVQQSDWGDVNELYTLYPQFIMPFYGVHPWYAEETLRCCPDFKSRLNIYLVENPRSGVGEIGLDKSPRALTRSSWNAQLEVFETQLQLAIELQRSISIHCVRAYDDVVKILSRFLSRSPQCHSRIILHSFSGPPGPKVIDEGKSNLYNTKVQISKTIQSIPLSRILVESDAPDQPLSAQALKSFFANTRSFRTHPFDDSIPSTTVPANSTPTKPTCYLHQHAEDITTHLPLGPCTQIPKDVSKEASRAAPYGPLTTYHDTLQSLFYRLSPESYRAFFDEIKELSLKKTNHFENHCSAILVVVDALCTSLGYDDADTILYHLYENSSNIHHVK